jgi:thiol-disulfide isomerase/thioredoxin
MKQLRYGVPILGSLALIIFFFSLPETPNLLGWCKTCNASHPFIVLIGAGYFAALIAVSLLFPNFPGRFIARAGFIWAVLLAAVLTYILAPNLCFSCLIEHACNILIWTIWLIAPPIKRKSSSASLRERLFLSLFAPIAVVALLSCLNLTFMAYDFKLIEKSASVQGENVPEFSLQTTEGSTLVKADVGASSKIVFNFISPDCTHCKEELLSLNAKFAKLPAGSSRLINVSPILTPELIRYCPTAEWVEDQDGKLRKLFKVAGFPTIIIAGPDNKIAQVVQGTPEQWPSTFIADLEQAN